MSIPLPPQHAPFQYQPQYQPPEPRKTFNWNLAGIVLAVALVSGGIGTVAGHAATSPKAPQSCLTALDLNEQAFGGLTDAMDYALDKEWTSATRSIEDVKALAPKVNAAKDACRASK